MTDAELVRQAQSGDRGAWKVLYARCLPSVWRYAVASVGDYTTAEDIVGETLIALVKGLSELDPENTDVHAWLRGVLRRKAVDHYRQRTRSRRLHNAVRKHSPASEGQPTGSSLMETEETRQQVFEALGQLSGQQRTILELKHVEDLSVREIAMRMGKTEKSIESALFRARREFRSLYQRVCSETHFIGNGSASEPETLGRSL